MVDYVEQSLGSGYPNVWLGVSIENSRFTWRADALRNVPAVVRFISAEPLIGSLFEARGNRRPLELSGVDWLIVGDESGPRSRRLDIAWVDEIAAVCDKTGVAFFMKQRGTPLARELGAQGRKSGDLKSFPRRLRRCEMPELALT